MKKEEVVSTLRLLKLKSALVHRPSENTEADVGHHSSSVLRTGRGSTVPIGSCSIPTVS